jgi:DNA-binding transcriptional ArsR family regulator
VTLLDPRLPPVLVYPVDPAPLPDRDRPDQRALGALVGNTRAAVLGAVGDGCSTSDLARRVQVSPAAASQHASILREAGLIVSTRDRNQVVHTLTPLGVALLNGA